MSNLAKQLERKNATTQYHETQIQTDLKRSGRITPGEKFLFFSAMIGVVFATYLITSSFASIYIANSEIHQLERSINTQEANNEALQLQVTELSAPDRILQIAMEELGMTLDDKNVKIVQN